MIKTAKQKRKERKTGKEKKSEERKETKNSISVSFEDRFRSLGANMPEHFQDGGSFGRIHFNKNFSLVVYFIKLYRSPRLGFS